MESLRIAERHFLHLRHRLASKAIQRRINSRLLRLLRLPATFHGAVKGRSTVSNAEVHVDKELVGSLDIRHYYPSIRHERVLRLFRNLGCVRNVAALLTRLTTFDYQLAQGFPTSPSVANLVLAASWPRLKSIAEIFGVSITIYQDDITISGDNRVYEAVRMVRRVIEDVGFQVHPTKSRIASRHERQSVTGWEVNEKVNIPREKYERARAPLFQCRMEGIERTMGKGKKEALMQIRGYIAEIGQVNPLLSARLLTD